MKESDIITCVHHRLNGFVSCHLLKSLTVRYSMYTHAACVYIIHINRTFVIYIISLKQVQTQCLLQLDNRFIIRQIFREEKQETKRETLSVSSIGFTFSSSYKCCCN